MYQGMQTSAAISCNLFLLTLTLTLSLGARDFSEPASFLEPAGICFSVAGCSAICFLQCSNSSSTSLIISVSVAIGATLFNPPKTLLSRDVVSCLFVHRSPKLGSMFLCSLASARPTFLNALVSEDRSACAFLHKWHIADLKWVRNV